MVDVEALSVLHDLLDVVTVATPNAPEAEILSGMPVRNSMEARSAADSLARRHGCAILLKGGHLQERGRDILAFGESAQVREFEPLRPFPSALHGTGCVLSSALLVSLVRHLEPHNQCEERNMGDAVEAARAHLWESVRVGLVHLAGGRLIERARRGTE